MALRWSIWLPRRCCTLTPGQPAAAGAPALPFTSFKIFSFKQLRSNPPVLLAAWSAILDNTS